MADDEKAKGLEESLKKISEIYAPNVLEAMKSLSGAAIDLNGIFGQGGDRFNEMQIAIGAATAATTKLGGNMDDALKTMGDIALGARRNVLAAQEDVSKLYAASKVLGPYSDVKQLVSALTDVGVQFAQAGDEIQKSINYVRTLGLNTQQIMGDVTNNMEKMNKFNFSNGVEGLTKMAAQSSIFRFSMNDTFSVMEKALTPEGAIELSSAFQRMGIAAGDLTDPFQLMYKSLNDPEGLQKSLGQMTEKFTYFDEKTKTFKISPEGMLQMRELQSQTGGAISYESLSKSALAAANLSAALKQLPASINASEEDKQLLANIGRMGKGGEYEVNIKDENGKDQYKKFSELNQEQIDKLIEEQKKGPTTLEEYARGQMKTMDIVQADLHYIRVNLESGAATAKQIMETEKLVRELTTSSTDIIAKAFPDQKEVRDATETTITTILGAIKELGSGNADTKKVAELGDLLNKEISTLKEKGLNSLADASTKLKDTAMKTVKESAPKILGPSKSTGKVESTNPKERNVTVNQKTTVDGAVTVKVEAGNANTAQIEQYLNTPDFRRAVYNALTNMDANALTNLKKSLKIS
jgi:hypothetical protein